MTIGEFLVGLTSNWRSFAIVALLAVVAYRMGRRGWWMIAPFVALIGGLALWYGVYGQAFDPSARSFEIVTPRLIYGWAFTAPTLSMLLLLAAIGPKRNVDIQGSVA